MKAYIASILTNLRLTTRDRGALFFGYLFPLIFFFIFASFMHAEQGGVILQVVTMVLIIGVLGNGFFGAGMRAVMEREANILRRYKVAPISAGPILAASLVTGWVNYMPSAILILTISHFMYGMAIPERLGSLFLFLSIGVVAFRALGLIIASVVNSMQESQIVIQLLYMPMLFLSGATIPTSIMPPWVQTVAQFLPATHLYSGMQSILVKKESIADNWNSTAALLLTLILATLLGIKLFRWEKEDKIAASGKMWLAAVLAPFIILGMVEANTKESIAKNKIVHRDLRRTRTTLIRGARIFVGDGRVIESGGVLIRDGKIAAVYADAIPDAKTLRAETLEAAGKTLLPGLIDLHVHLGAPGGVPDRESFGKGGDPTGYMKRELAAYLYSGVTTVKSVGDSLASMKKLSGISGSGEYLASELVFAGPMFTTGGGHGTEYFKDLPENIRRMLEGETLRLPRTAAEAKEQVAALKKDGVGGIKAILETGAGSRTFNRLDSAIFMAIGEEAKAQGLPLAVHTGDNRDIADAIAAGAAIIEHGSAREPVSQENLEKMAKAGIAYDATLTVLDALDQIRDGRYTAFERSLVQQAAPGDLLASTKRFFASPEGAKMRDAMRNAPLQSAIAIENLKRARAAGVTLAMGTDAGNMLVFHGPTVQRELQLYVAAGVPPAEALTAATRNAARVLNAGDRIGLIQAGYSANLLLVDGNPLTDIAAAERISLVVFRGERVDKSELFEQ